MADFQYFLPMTIDYPCMDIAVELIKIEVSAADFH
jgi:hypothetical protein